MARFGFDTNEYGDFNGGDFPIIPEGTEVKIMAEEAELKKTSAGTGEYIATTFVVVDGPHKDRKIWMNFNISNPSQKAQDIGRRQLSGWARACGLPNAQDTDELLNRVFSAKLGIEKGTGEYKDRNRIDAFLTPNGSASSPAPAPASRPAPAAPSPAPASSAPAPAAASAPANGKKKAPWDD